MFEERKIRDLVEISTPLTGVATLLLVAVADWQVWALRQEAKRDRRPYLFVVVDKGRTRDEKDALYLSFTNYGRTPAIHVRAKITGPVWKQLNNRTLAFERDSGILLLAPGPPSPISLDQHWVSCWLITAQRRESA